MEILSPRMVELLLLAGIVISLAASPAFAGKRKSDATKAAKPKSAMRSEGADAQAGVGVRNQVRLPQQAVNQRAHDSGLL